MLSLSFHCDTLHPHGTGRERRIRVVRPARESKGGGVGESGISRLDYAPIWNLNPASCRGFLTGADARCPKEKRRGVDASATSPQSRIGNAESTRPRGTMPPVTGRHPAPSRDPGPLAFAGVTRRSRNQEPPQPQPAGAACSWYSALVICARCSVW
jgi:hypothetical protein